MSTAMKPVTASMQIRPCFNSASRRKSTGAKSENRKGSNPASPAYPARFGGYSRKGRAVLATYVGPASSSTASSTASSASAASSRMAVATRPKRAKENQSKIFVRSGEHRYSLNKSIWNWPELVRRAALSKARCCRLFTSRTLIPNLI